MITSSISPRFQRLVMAALLPAFAALPVPLSANPEGAVVVSGAATFDTSVAGQLAIHQTSKVTLIDWGSFDIGADELTQFFQPDSNSTAFNRVNSGALTTIQGALRANGNVFVINPNGVLISSSGIIDVGGSIVVSTLDIDNKDFLNGGSNRFSGNSLTGVTNHGSIFAAAGDVILLGGFIDNQGQIGALNGTVALGAGGDFLVSQAGGAEISVQGGSSYDGVGVNNEGSIRGAAVDLKAHGNVYALAINNGGTVRANGATRSGGRVRLMASGASSDINVGNQSYVGASGAGSVQVASAGGDVSIGGTVDVSGEERAGSISVTGRNVTLGSGAVLDASAVGNGGVVVVAATGALDSSANVTVAGRLGAGGVAALTGDQVALRTGAAVSASGSSAGGHIRVGGEFQGRDSGLREATSTVVESGVTLAADGLHGNAGSIVVWANNDTIFRGDASAAALGSAGNGGLIEVSGAQELTMLGSVRASSLAGEAGSVLFDPGTLTVGYFNNTPGVNQIEVAFINSTLQGGTSVILATEGMDSDIIFNDIDLAGQQAGGGVFGGAVVGLNADGTINPAIGFNDANHPRNLSIQWTNSAASFGAFAGGSIFVNNDIRTSGAGSINLIAGWGGLEADIFGGTAVPLLFDTQLRANAAYVDQFNGASSVQDFFTFYVSNGQFGLNDKSIFVGSPTQTRSVEVGSRFGDTSLAASGIFVTAADTNDEARYTQVGFHDSGVAFAPRFDGAAGNIFDLDLNNRALEEDNNPLVGIVGYAERDVNGDGVVDGVYAVNRAGVQNGMPGVDNDGTVVNGDATFISYANHFSSSRVGNWWWQQIDAAARTSGHTGFVAGYAAAETLGGRRPEMGAGQTVLNANGSFNQALSTGADINLIARGNITVTAGGRGFSGAYIGHGGNGAANADDVSLSDTGTVSGSGEVQSPRQYTINGSTHSISANSIGRLAPVYGNINLLAGVAVGSPVSYNDRGIVTAATTGLGSILIRGLQRMGSANNPANEEQNDAQLAPAQVGHGGVGQFGEFRGDIVVQAANRVDVLAGSGTNSYASIGHTVGNRVYWNPTSTPDQQIRFFRDSVDFDDPLLRRGQLFMETTNIPSQTAAGDTYTTDNNRPPRVSSVLSNPGPAGVVPVAALDGSIIKGFHGDIKVTATNGAVNVVAYSTPDRSTDALGTGGLATNRNRRFAKIGHGGVGTAFGNERSGYVPNRADRTLELVQLRVRPGDSGSGSIIGEFDSDFNRSLNFMTITGDIDVKSGGNLTVQAGNFDFDYAQIGHGGTELSDYETSSFVVGDINIEAGGNINLLGGGQVKYTGASGPNTQNNILLSLRSFSLIGHGGFRSGSLGYFGDINVKAGLNIDIVAGAYQYTFAKIGHQAVEDYGQVGGDFARTENFFFDSASTDITTSLLGNVGTVTYASANRGVTGQRTFNVDKTTSNVSVEAQGNITLRHLGEGVSENARQLNANLTSANVIGNGTQASPEFPLRRRFVNLTETWAQIGHGGRNTDLAQNSATTNPSYAFADKTGNISVISNLANIALSNAGGTGRWTRIGHGVGIDDQASGVNGSAVELTGNITVDAAGDVVVDASVGSESSNPLNPSNTVNAAPLPSVRNPVVIGHGGVLNNRDIVVLGAGENVNGIIASSDISVTAGRDVIVRGGNGGEASFGQIGHGFASDAGDDFALRNGVPTGFTGDIFVSAVRDVIVKAGDNALIAAPFASANTNLDGARSVFGAFAAIGNGGYQLDAPVSGDITVFAGRDISIRAQERTDPENTLTAVNALDSADLAIVSEFNGAGVNQNSAAQASVFNFAKIGHVNAENQGRLINNNDSVNTASQLGNIRVVATRDLSVRGGTTPDINRQTILGAFAQIGHGGPGISGDLEGTITVLVGNNLEVIGGSEVNLATPLGGVGPNPLLRNPALNNYAMIGHGDRVYEANGSLSYTFSTEAAGARDGNIVVSVGEDAVFNNALIGHADPRVSTQTTEGITQVAVSRNNPFYGGSGILEARNNTVFSSGGGGLDRLQFYMPARSSLSLLDATTRFNESLTPVSARTADFANMDPSMGIYAGRADEIFLTPDLFYATIDPNQPPSGAAPFPTNATSGQGGSIAEVASPGGFANLISLTAGALGSSETAYRSSNGVSGAGNYTFYFDAISPVAFLPSGPFIPPPAPIVPPGLSTVLFLLSPQYSDILGGRTGLRDGLYGDGDPLYSSLGIFETNEEGVEDESAMDEEEARRRARNEGTGPLGLIFYVYEPGTNQLSSYHQFGYPAGSLFIADPFVQ